MTPPTPTDQLTRALRGAADELVAGAHPRAADAAAIWKRGRRAAWAARAAAAGLVATALLLLGTVAVVMRGGPTTTPADTEGLTYPALVSDLFPGLHVAGSTPVFGFVTGPHDSRTSAHTIDRRGLLSVVPGSSPLALGGALAPDGRHLLVDDGVVDLDDGILRRMIANDETIRSRVVGSGVWAPDSAHVLIDTANGPAVLDTFAVVTTRPGSADADVTPAGWRDATTALGVREYSDDGQTVLDVVTRGLSDEAWSTVARIRAPAAQSQQRPAAVHASPDGSRLLLRYSPAPEKDSEPAVLVDAESGEALPVADRGRSTAIEWDGCPPVWRVDEPLLASGGLSRVGDAAPVMRFSGRIPVGCVSLAGSELSGSPDPDSAGDLRERAWRVAVPLGVVIALIGAVWVVLALRRSRRLERPGRRWLPMIYVQRF